MKKISILLFTIFTLFGGGIIQAQQCADFNTLGEPTNANLNTTNWGTYTSTEGWVCTNVCRMIGGGASGNAGALKYKAMEIGERGVNINGSQMGGGSVVSPLLTTGCNSITFNYAVRSSNVSRPIHFYITQNEAVVWDSIVDLSVPTLNTKYEYTFDDIAVEGAFQLHIVNELKANVQYGGDVTIWNLCLTDYGAPVAATPAITITGNAHPDGGFWDEAAVSLSAEAGASIYYTTDNTEPTESSSVYSEPFTLTETTRVKAIAVANGLTSETLDTLITITPTPPSQCAHTDDFANTTPPGGYLSSYISADGWTWRNSRNYPPDDYLEINGGGTSTYGFILSPSFYDGCGSVAFSYTSLAKGGTKLIVEVLKGGTAIYTKDITLSQDGAWYEFKEENLNIEGEYQLKITNDTKSGNQTPISLIRVKGICLTTYGAPQAPPAPGISISGNTRSAGGFWDEATVSLSASPTTNIYYTTDNTLPTAASATYSEPFKLTETTRVKAITVANELASEVLDTLITITATPAYMKMVTLTMNSVSRTMTLTEKGGGTPADIGVPTAAYVYTFPAEPGDYVLSAYDASGNSNGTLDLTITDEDNQSISIVTVTAGATNSGWVLDTDYTLEYRAVGKEGAVRNVTAGTSTTANRITFPMFLGDSYFVNIIPNAAHSAPTEGERYMKTGLFGTVTTATKTAAGAAMQGSEFSFTVPAGASLFVGEKQGAVNQGTGGIHYVPFPEKEPITQSTENGKTTYQFILGTGTNVNYNYRVSQTGKITNAGKFTRNTYTNSLEITGEMLSAARPDSIDHSPASNDGANVGDILLNINAQGHLKLNQGNVRSILALRSWQLTDDCCNNYFIEPDFRFTALNENGQPDNSVITVDEKGLINAVGTGTAIVQVTYDAVSLLSHKYTSTSNTTLPFYFGSFWGAIWPENTGTFVVSVGGGDDASIKPNMYVREQLGTAGGNVDAEFDVFYYHEDSVGYRYTFKPEGVASVSIANPAIGTHEASYSGFTPITANADGSYSLLLTFGSNIVKLTSANGVSKYQVVRAKPCGYTIANNTNPGEPIRQGDEAAIQFHGFFHPANKLAGIYNQTPAILYNGVPNNTTLILSPNQYQFGGTPSAQLVKVTVPEDWDTEEDYVLKDGAIQINGFGSIQGKHRSISTVAGVAPNFTAEVRVGYFGSIPDVNLHVLPAIPTGVDANNYQLSVYPNPFADYLNVKTNEESEISIYNLVGKCVHIQTLTAGEYKIDTSELTSGVYIMKMANKNSQVTVKVIKK